MKSRLDLVRLWVLKAESDLCAVKALISLNQSSDVACFHCQQAIEKYLKAYLIQNRMTFPFIHDLERLLGLCSRIDSSFEKIISEVRGLTEYALQPRYDPEFWPSIERAKSARDAAVKIREFVLARLPADVQPSTEKNE